MVGGIKANDHRRLNEGSGSKFRVGCCLQQDTPEEDRRIYRPKRNEYNTEDKDNSPKTLNDKNLWGCVSVSPKRVLISPKNFLEFSLDMIEKQVIIYLASTALRVIPPSFLVISISLFVGNWWMQPFVHFYFVFSL